nr:hypothetical protein [Tanacetum cinerariifolium]
MALIKFDDGNEKINGGNSFNWLPIRGDAAAPRLSLSEAMVPMIEPLSAENLIGEASTFEVLITATTTALSTTFIQASTIPLISVSDGEVLGVGPCPEVAHVPSLRYELSIAVPELVLLLRGASVTSYGPSHLGLSFSLSFARLTSLFRSRLISKASSFYTMSIFAVLKVGMPISVGMTASVPYVSENSVYSLLDLIIVRYAYKTCGISSIQSLLLSSSLAFIPSPKLLFALSSKPLAYGCLTEAKRRRFLSHQSLNGLSLNCFPLSDIISPR